jgi:hypothetical protein
MLRDEHSSRKISRKFLAKPNKRLYAACRRA